MVGWLDGDREGKTEGRCGWSMMGREARSEEDVGMDSTYAQCAHLITLVFPNHPSPVST
jgi:hypothetical protein